MTTRIRATVRVEVAAAAREIAESEQCSLSSVVRRSLELCDVIPKDLRDLIMELNADGDKVTLQRMKKELDELAIRARAETVTLKSSNKAD